MKRQLLYFIDFFSLFVIFANPVADFSANTVCEGSETIFTNNSHALTGDIVLSIWEFGDGNTSTNDEPKYIYESGGTYTVTLTVMDENGDFDEAQRSITVLESPDLDFIVSSDSYCAGEEIHFINLSSGASSYLWDFGTSSTSIPNPIHVFDSPGIIEITLEGSNSNCASSVLHSIEIFEIPSTDFSFQNSCPGVEISFENNSQISSGLLQYDWHFGDGSQSSNVEPSHSYANSGEYPVSLIAISSQGCSNVKEQAITIYNDPVIDFEVNDICQDDTSVFLNNSEAGLNYLWDFDDGNTSDHKSPGHFYESPGHYKITLSVENSEGCSNQLSRYLNVFQRPLANFSNSSLSCIGEPIQFENNSIPADIDFTWDFGDSFKSKEVSPDHTFIDQGIYNVSLISTNSYGCQDTLKQQVEVVARPNPGEIIGNSLLCEDSDNKLLRLENYEGEIIQWEWSNEDKDVWNVVKSSKDVFNLNTITLGNTKVRARIGNEVCESELSEEFNIEIVDQSVSGNISGPTEICTGDSAVLELSNYQGVISWFTKNSQSDSWSQLPNHSESIEIELTSTTYFFATVSNGICEADSSEVFKVEVIDPSQSGIITGKERICTYTNLTLSLENHRGEINWQRSNNENGNWVNLSEKSSTLTLFDISQSGYFRTIATNGSCPADTSNIFFTEVIDKPISGEITGPSEVCEGIVNDYIRLSDWSGDDIQWQESFEGIHFNGSANGTQLFIDSIKSDTYFRAIVSNEECESDTSELFELKYIPRPMLSIKSDTVCQGDLTTIKTKIENTSDQIDFLWIFNENLISETKDFTYKFPKSGINPLDYYYRSSACSDSASLSVMVHPKPAAGEINFENACEGDSVNIRFLPDNPSYNYFWDLKEEENSNEITFLFDSSAAYPITLNVETKSGCQRSFSRTIDIFANPDIRIGLPENECTGENITIKDSSENFEGTYLWEIDGFGSSRKKSLTVKFQEHGEKIVKLKKTSSRGCISTGQKEILIRKIPDVSFQADNTCLNSVTSFINNTEEENNSFQWDFGDGSRSNVFQPAHLYKSAGTYTVLLTTKSIYGCENQFQKEIEIYPSVDFSFSSKEACSGEDVPVELDIDRRSLKSIFWESNNATFSGLNPSIVFEDPGDYQIKAIYSDTNNCTSEYSGFVTIHPTPYADFAFTESCEGDTVFMQNRSSVVSGDLTFDWDFGDGTSASSINPSKQFWNSGRYIIQLTVESEKGCIDHASKNIAVFKSPVADFEVDNVCEGEEIVLINRSSSESNLSYRWSMDLDTLFSENPVLTYSDPGDYKVQLLIESENGCKDSLYRYFQVYQKPNVTISSENLLISKGESILLKAEGAETYAWEPIDYLSNSNISNPIATPLNDIHYRVFGVSINGCTSDDSVSISVSEDYQVYASNLFTPDANGLNDTWIVRNIENYDNVRVEVVDRNGRLVYVSDNYQNDWSGTYRGNKLPDGTYYYSIRFPDANIEHSGALTILKAE